MKRIMLSIVLWLAALTPAEWVAGGMLAVGILLAGLVTPLLQKELRVHEDALRALERAERRGDVRPIIRTSEVQQRLDRFYSVLAHDDQLERSVGRLFELARKSGVALAKADYRLATEKTGQYRTYQINLPMKASYPAILAFCDQVLAELPFASLDAVRFHRDNVGSGQIEATIRLTFFVSPHPSLPSPHRASPAPETRLIAETVR
jgi:hypothetical protein